MGFASIICGAIGGLVGIYAGFKLSEYKSGQASAQLFSRFSQQYPTWVLVVATTDPTSIKNTAALNSSFLTLRNSVCFDQAAVASDISGPRQSLGAKSHGLWVTKAAGSAG